MNNYLDLKFSWFNKNIKSVVPAGEISLRQFINAVMNPKEHIKQAFIDIQKAADEGNLKLKDELKQKNLFFTTPSVKVSYRNYEGIENFLPFVVAEYDKIGEHAEILKNYVFEKFKSCVFAFLSPSKTGCKFIFLLEKTPESVEEYKEYFYGIAHYLDKFVGFDESNVRCVLPLFNSWDENALFREDAVGSNLRGYKDYAYELPEIPIEPKGEYTDEERKGCIRLITTLIDRIEDNGHNQVISASFVAGTFSAYYGLEELWDVLEDRIIDNDYLSKGTKGYLKTASEMYAKGTFNPQPLKND